jgi:predicted small secreted protein
MKSRILRWLSMPVALLALTLSMSACNTMEGVGEDVEAAGSRIDKTAEDARG